jgi:hypothetical protein
MKQLPHNHTIDDSVELDDEDTEQDPHRLPGPDCSSDLQSPLARPAMLERLPQQCLPMRYDQRDSTEATLDLDDVRRPPTPVLPFVPAQDLLVGRHLRLQQFDPQTGQRLDPPTWVWRDELHPSLVAAAHHPRSASHPSLASARTPTVMNVKQLVEPGTTSSPARTRKGLSVAEFATIRALLDAGQPRAGVLAAHRLTDARWREQEEQVLSDLADAAERADLAQLEAYQEAYRATRDQTEGDELVLPAGGIGASSAGRDPEVAGSVTLDVDLGALVEALPFKFKKTDER